MLDNRPHNVHVKRANTLEELQELVLGLNATELTKLQSWLKDKDRFSEDICSVLPDAVLKSVKNDSSLSDALLPVIESAIFSSVQKNPKALADALFPIMGPAIRQSISDTFHKMIQSLNETLEKQFSIERLKWKLEAAFSSKSFAEIVLLKGMKFNVLTAMLIHKESGLLLHEVHTENQDFDEADMISSMLKAVQDFVHDSFNNHINENDTLDTLRLNELNVWIVDGPFAFLAIVFDGDAPESRRTFFKSKLEIIHHKFGKEMKNFDGDNSNSESIIPILKECVIDNSKPPKTKKSNTKPLLLGLAILIGIVIWTSFSIYRSIQRDNFISSIENIESVVVVNHTIDNGKLLITAMKDASVDGFSKSKSYNILDSSDYKINWINYLSTDSKFILARFNKYLVPENTVSINLENNVMIFTGKATQLWIDKAKEYSKINSGLFSSDFSLLQYIEAQEFTDIKTKIRATNITFDNGVSVLNKYQKNQLDTLLYLFNSYNQYEKIKEIQININLDINGTSSENLRFAKSRKRGINNYLMNNKADLSNIKYNILNAKISADARLISFKIISE